MGEEHHCREKQEEKRKEDGAGGERTWPRRGMGGWKMAQVSERAWPRRGMGGGKDAGKPATNSP